MSRKPIEITELLGWAYRQELPKIGSGPAASLFGRAPMADFAELATLIDRGPNGFGCIPMSGEVGDADPDAVRVGRAVQALDDLDFGTLAGIDMLADLDGTVILDQERVKAHEDGARIAFADDGRPRRSASIAVATVAKLGPAPETPPIGPVRRSFVKRHGKAAWFRWEPRIGTGGRTILIEVDGYDRRAKRPHKDAFRKFTIAPDLGPIVADRIDYRIWRMSLDHLALTLEGTLERFEPTPSRAPAWPWEGEQTRREARVWPSLANGD